MFADTGGGDLSTAATAARNYADYADWEDRTGVSIWDRGLLLL